MNVGSVLVLIALVAIDRFLHKRFPRFYQRIQLPALIFAWTDWLRKRRSHAP